MSKSMMSKEETECFAGVLELHEFFIEAGHMRELQATITELTAALERIAGRRNCYHDINGCGAAQDAKLALRGNDDE